MAKSTGNVYTLPDLQARGFEPLAFRYLCATTHYRRRLNFTFDSLRAAAIGLNRLRQEAFLAAQAPDRNGGAGAAWEEAFWAALEDDLHLPRALAVVWQLVRSDAPAGVKARLLQTFDRVLGLDLLSQPASVPDVVRVLVDERQDLRVRGDFAQADKLRERIAAAGFHVRDTRSGPAAVPLLTPPPAKIEALHSSHDVPSRLNDPDELSFSVIVTGRDDLEALQRTAASVLRHGGAGVELIIIDNGSSDGTAAWLGELASRESSVQAVRCDHNLGTAAARNVGLRRARGRNVAIIDTSIELAGDALSPLAAALEEDGSGVVGPFGVNTADLRDFTDAPGPEVDAVEGYLMAFRRDRVREVGLMDEKFRFYRHLDLDYSLAFRDCGYRNRIVPGLPLRRHAHSDWERTPAEERDRLSKRNFYRFLKKYGHREDLLVASNS
jgi:cysteinyl-tRNA synthetase